jgi:hypothetical protein
MERRHHSDDFTMDGDTFPHLDAILLVVAMGESKREQRLTFQRQLMWPQIAGKLARSDAGPVKTAVFVCWR